MNKFFLFLIFSIICECQLSSQVLLGDIKDTNGNPIPFSTVYIRELSLGAAANLDGYFELKLKAGTYVCVFQSLGYQPVIKTVDVNKSTAPLHIVLPDMVYDLSTVVISGKEDPAYRIMRNVIAKAPEYANLVKSFEAEVYIKGSLYIKSISKLIKLMAKDDLKEFNIKEGETYLQESVNEIDFTSPDFTRQRVISIKSTFPDFGQDQSNNAIGFISGNIYKPDGFGAAYSPILPGAFNYYNFKFEGRTNYDTYSVDKITILPKGKGAQYIEGTLYIVDGLWCISNLDIYKEEQLGVKLALTQNYEVVKEGAWLPISNRMKIDMDLMGNSGTFNYNTSIRYKELSVNVPGYIKPLPRLVSKSPKAIAFHEKTKTKIDKRQKMLNQLLQIENPNTAQAYKIARIQQKQEELRIKDSLRFNHQYVESYKTVVDSNARKQDSSFWNKIRPIPLTLSELKSLRVHDSLALTTVHDTDSVAKKTPKFKFGNLILGGYLRFDTVYTFRTRGLINPFSLNFNLVDGLQYHTSATFSKKLKTRDIIGIQPMIGYAFARKALFWEVLGFSHSIGNEYKVGFKFGQQSRDYNTDGIHPLETTIEALIFRENPARFYHASYADLAYEHELLNDFTVIGNLYFADNTILKNVSNYSFFYRDKKEYEPNIPENPLYKMANHQDFSFEVAVKYKPMPFYYIKNGVKQPYWQYNDYPEFKLTWRKGLPVGMFDTDYDLLSFEVRHQKRLGMTNFFNYKIEAGYFVNTKSMWFNEFKHFAKRPLIAGVKEFFPYFLLLDSYSNSTNDHYIVSHFQYKSPFIALKRLPVLRNRLWTESLFFSHLYTPINKNYMEVGYGIGSILFNLGVFTGFEDLKYRQTGIRLSINLFGTKEITL